MSLDQDMVRLVKEIVRQELDGQRLRTNELTGRGGDTIISSRGDIYLTPGLNKRAWYKGTEVGSGTGGGGGAVTSVFGRTGAVTAQDSDYVNYLLLNGTRPMVGDLNIHEGSPMVFFKNAAGTTQYGGVGSLGGHMYLQVDSVSENIFLQVNSVTKLQISNGGVYLGTTLDLNLNPIINTGDITIKEATPMLYFTNAASSPLGSIGSLGGGLYIGNDVAAGSIFIQTGAAPATTRIQVYDTGVALGVDLVMGAKNITLTSGLVDGVDVSAIPSTYLPLTGGTLTNDLIIKDATPFLYFTTDADAPLGSIGSTGGGLYVKNDVDSGSIYIQTGSGAGTTRIQVYDTGVALGVPLVMGSNAITTSSTVDGVDVSAIPSTYLALAGGAMTGDVSFTDGTGIDLRNDNVHKISYASGTNSMDISSYTIINLKTTVDSNTPLSVASDGVRLAEGLFFKKNHADDYAYIVDSATGDLEFHVKTGDVFKFVVDA